MSIPADTCANCAHPIERDSQKFCPECGQPTPAHRIDWQFLSHELQHSVFHVDKGILFTIRHLLTRPGHMIRDYIQGKRGNHFKPVLLIMILGAVVTLLSKYVLGMGLLQGFAKIQTVTPAESAEVRKEVGIDPQGFVQSFSDAGNWMSDHFAVATLLLLPFMALAFKIAFRKFRNLNYPEWLVISAFLTAQSFVIFAVGIILRRWFDDIYSFVILIQMLVNILTLVQFFQGYPKWKSFLRASAGYIIYFIFNGLLLAAFVAIALSTNRV